MSSFSTSSVGFRELDVENVILFQLKNFGRNIKETTQARHFVMITAYPIFTRLRVTRRINRVY